MMKTFPINENNGLFVLKTKRWLFTCQESKKGTIATNCQKLKMKANMEYYLRYVAGKKQRNWTGTKKIDQEFCTDHESELLKCLTNPLLSKFLFL